MTHTLTDLTDRLGDLLGDRPTAEAALCDAMRDLAFLHADHLHELGPIRVLALDPCPRCGGSVIASEVVARCATCDYTVGRRTA